MEPAKRSSEEPIPNAKIPRSNPSFFENPANIAPDKLLETASNALVQLKMGARPSHEKIIRAIRTWTTNSLYPKEFSKLIRICHQILQLDGQLRNNPQSKVTVGFDLTKFTLTETQAELLNINSTVIHELLEAQEIANPESPIFIQLDKLIEDEAAKRGIRFKLELEDLEALVQFLEKGIIPAQQSDHFAQLATLLRMPSFAYELSIPRMINIFNTTDVTTLMNLLMMHMNKNEDSQSSDFETLILQIILINPKIITEMIEEKIIFLIGPSLYPVGFDEKNPISMIADILHLIQTVQPKQGLYLLRQLSQPFQQSRAGRMLLFRLSALNKEFKESDRIIDELDREINFHRFFREQRFAYYQERISMLKGKKKWEEASLIIEKLLKENPNNCDLLLQRAKIQLWKKENIDDIIGSLQELLAINPKHKKALLFYAEMLTYKNKFTESLDIFNQLVAEKYKPLKVYRLRGNLWYKLKRYHEALNDFLELTKIEPNNTVGYTLAARTYITMKNFTEAARCVKIAESIYGEMTEETMLIREKLPPEFDIYLFKPKADEESITDTEEDEEQYPGPPPAPPSSKST